MIEFSLFGINIKIKFMFLAVVTIFLIVDNTSMSIIALLACIIHELGHLIMFAAVGSKPQELAFEMTGIRLTKPSNELPYFKEILVQLAGSSLNFLVFLMLIKTTSTINQLSIFAVTHLVIGVFNLLPIKSFDGGKLLELMLIRFMSMRAANIICNTVDILCILLLLILGLYSFFAGTSSFTLVVLSAFLMFTAIIKLDL